MQRHPQRDDGAPLVADGVNGIPAERLQHRREALFNGWFGPIGIAAPFYAAEASHMTHIDRIWTIASLVVFASILLHGMSATPLIRRFGGLIALRPAGQDGRSEP